MKVGIAGFSGSGKSTVFLWLTGVAPDPSRSQQGQIGKPEIPDERLDWVSDLFKPKKKTAAKIEFLDTPGLNPSERRDNPRRLGIMRDAGGLLIVLNGYSGGNVAEELKKFQEEMLFADLEIVLGRIERLEDQLKKPRPAKDKDRDQLEIDTLKKVADVLEIGKPASVAHLRDDEEKAIRSFQLLTLKKQMVFVNLDEAGVKEPLPADLLALAPEAIGAPAKLEMELAELSPDDRKAFMEDLGVTGFSQGDALRKIFTGMGNIVFFTVGEDECRAWPIPKGATAVEGAGEIHTDLARGFVRGEVVSYADFKRLGSMKEAKTHGVYRLEGKTYVVQDGDIMHILAST
jgi:ribosome-binding ATPase YchF (GTP1/OBG family)